MYICICKAVTDGQIRTAIHNGICTHRQLIHCFGVGKDCGKCNKEVNELLTDVTQPLNIATQQKPVDLL